MGWGSVVPGTAEEMARFAVEAAMAAGARAIVLGGWADISAASLPPGALREYAAQRVLFCSGSLPHEWLFPQCACAVHHGGAGTVAAVLRSGIPQVASETRAAPPSARERFRERSLSPRTQEHARARSRRS